MAKSVLDVEEARRLTAEGLRLCLAGDEAAEGSTGGQLRVGGWEDPAPPGWPDESIAPEPGLLVVLPSWYVHWTEPTGAEGPRLAITTEAVAA